MNEVIRSIYNNAIRAIEVVLFGNEVEIRFFDAAILQTSQYSKPHFHLIQKQQNNHSAIEVVLFGNEVEIRLGFNRRQPNKSIKGTPTLPQPKPLLSLKSLQTTKKNNLINLDNLVKIKVKKPNKMNKVNIFLTATLIIAASACSSRSSKTSETATPETIELENLDLRDEVYYYNDVPYTGKALWYAPDGAEGTASWEMKEGKFHGEHKRRSSEWGLTGNYKNGKKHGEWTETEPCREVIQNYLDDMKHGEWKYYLDMCYDKSQHITEIWENDALMQRTTEIWENDVLNQTNVLIQSKTEIWENDVLISERNNLRQKPVSAVGSIHVSFAGEDLSKYEPYTSFIEEDVSEYAFHIAITTQKHVKDFKWIGIDRNDDGVILGIEELFSLPDFTEDITIIAAMTISGKIGRAHV